MSVSLLTTHIMRLKALRYNVLYFSPIMRIYQYWLTPNLSFLSLQSWGQHHPTNNVSPVMSHHKGAQYTNIDAAIGNSFDSGRRWWGFWYIIWRQRFWEPVFRIYLNCWSEQQGYCENYKCGSKSHNFPMTLNSSLQRQTGYIMHPEHTSEVLNLQ